MAFRWCCEAVIICFFVCDIKGGYTGICFLKNKQKHPNTCMSCKDHYICMVWKCCPLPAKLFLSFVICKYFKRKCGFLWKITLVGGSNSIQSLQKLPLKTREEECGWVRDSMMWHMRTQTTVCKSYISNWYCLLFCTTQFYNNVMQWFSSNVRRCVVYEPQQGVI